ncbi:prepilin peptidase [Pelosinus propionicus]|uniref:Prepilin leader peptidase/N-methyltransferase n=1 Tax=Pelosinus propionicus DSM 13327 TaxID=1123291 RepID=A0A1I4HD85_9FIRM|nr:A24 family peptidase [Pelosinus propionicus]SFL40238.1 type 4 prepilin peptidase 1 Aspartic peptidase. MEROPS family A24A [Pelosinus propionicus DSM 13327]
MLIIVILLGFLIGSFLNVCICRLPYNQSIIIPSSHCSICGAHLKLWDLIPVISYLLLRGSCRYCKATFSSRYLLVEIITAILFSVCFQTYGLTCLFMKAIVLTAFLLIITFIDYDHQLILDKVLLWFSGAGIVINFLTNNLDFEDMLLSSLLGGGLLFIIALVSRGGMGDGDIKFAATLGIWLTWKCLLLVLLLSFVCGGIGGLLLVLFNFKSHKDFIPFGPCMALSAFVTMLYGSEIIIWYLEMLY